MKVRLALWIVLSTSILMHAVSAEAGEIRWRSGTADLGIQSAGQTAEALSALALKRTHGHPQHIVVQFSGSLTPAEQLQLEQGGLRLLNYLGDHAYFAAISPAGIDVSTIAACSSLDVVAPIRREWKLHPSLIAGRIPAWAVVDTAHPRTRHEDESSSPTFSPTGEPGTDAVVAVYVLFHADVDLQTAAAELAARYEGNTRSMLNSINGIVLELPSSNIEAMADEDAVQYVEPPLPRFTTMNNSSRVISGADAAQAAPYGLDGSGVSVLVYDGGTALPTHTDLIGRVNVRDGSGLAEHSTHVAGIVGGDGTQSTGLYRGMAPAVVIEAYGFETGGPLEAGFLYTDPGDIESDYDEAINIHGADIANNSIGTNTAPNGFPCEWTGDYGITSALIDAIVRGSLGSPFRVIWANGNERQTERCGELYHTTAPPACAKNHITIGALNSNDDSVTDFTSWGPADDGRLKPDVSGPGCQSDDDEGVTSTSSGGGYTVHCGTSMAAPTVCGLSALLMQDYRVYYPGDPDFLNSTLKALLAHTAQDVANAGPDYQSGYGSVRIVPAIEQMRSGHWIEKSIVQGDVYQMVVVVEPGDPALKVTIAWDDAPGTPNVDPALVNDLDLRVLDELGGVHYPWTLDPFDPAAPAVRSQADHLNNIEQVYIENPVPGVYVIEIEGYVVPAGPQACSLVASPTLLDCSTKGRVKLDRIAYQCQTTATIEVVDCDLNTDDGVVESVGVIIESDSEPGGESVLLTETGPATARFEGSISIDTTDAIGVLLVLEGDDIEVSYIDADDGFGGIGVTVTDTAVIDCTSPLIQSITVQDIEPRAAKVRVETDENATAIVRYGESCGALNDTVYGPGFSTVHTPAISGLTELTDYYYEVEVEDPAGNVTIDDNSGACHVFATAEIPDYFSELFITASPFDLANTSILFYPDGSFQYYRACSETISSLPTDPAGGTTLTLGDTDSARIELSGGEQIRFYGTAYAAMYINANGNITFDLPDNDSSESYEDHFSQPRISAFFDDLNPSLRGEISWRQMADRVAVTWDDVTEDYTANSNTFQVEMYFDGRLRLSWLGMTAIDGLVGLSQGFGIPIDFEASNMSAFDACGPRPPSATSVAIVVGKDRVNTLKLWASDDGQPDPPGMLEYIIVSLPSFELRDADNDHVIMPGDLPYTLVNGGDSVVYTTTGGFLGGDSFQFKVDDGGTPPDAGESNVATVSIQVAPVLSLPFNESFPLTGFSTARWALVTNASIDDVGLNEPSAPYAARLNGYPEGYDQITTHLFDLSGFGAVRLAYSWQRTGGGDSPESGDDMIVEFYDSAGIWQEAGFYEGPGPDMTEFETEEIFLPSTALHQDFRLRFRAHGTKSGSSILDDWFVDDISLTVADSPLAKGAWVAVPIDGVRDIALTATDPNGDPMDFIITSLPANGTLTDPGAGVIGGGMLPYTLVAQGNVVQYQPDLAFSGEDSFMFKASDGAFESNVATVRVSVETVLSLPFSDDFPTTTFDAGKWSLVQYATIDDVGIGEPSPPYAARFNGLPEGNDAIQTFAIDLAGLGQTQVTYYWQRTGGGNSPETGDDLVLEYLDSTGEWQELNRHDGGGADMTVFQMAQLILPADAMHLDFRLRISSSGDLGSFDDWFLDDLSIVELQVPIAYGQSIEVPKFATALISLAAFDPNQDPLDFIILSLPTVGELRDDGTGTAIEPADLPHTLVAGGNSLHYFPPDGYVGQETFEFKVSDGVNESNTAVVTMVIGEPQIVYEFLMDTDPGWSTQGQWAYGVPQGISGDPFAGYTGPKVYGYNLAGKYANAIPVYYLTTTMMDCSDCVDTTLRFYRWLGVEAAQYDHASIEASVNGTDWVVVWQHSGPTLNEQTWTQQTYDISAIADLQPALYIRWGMGPTDGGVSFHGWNIDDVQLRANLQLSPADIERDGDVDEDDVIAFVAALLGSPLFPEHLNRSDLNGDAVADGLDIAEFVGYAIDHSP